MHNIDIILISETHFTGKSYLNIPDYSIYCTNHPDGTAHGGSTVIIKSTIKHHLSDKYQTPYIQATSITIVEWTGHIVTTAIYCPSRHTIKENQFSDFNTRQ